MIKFDPNIPLVRVAEAAERIGCELYSSGGDIIITPKLREKDEIKKPAKVLYMRKMPENQERRREYLHKLVDAACDGNKDAQKMLNEWI